MADDLDDLDRSIDIDEHKHPANAIHRLLHDVAGTADEYDAALDRWHDEHGCAYDRGHHDGANDDDADGVLVPGCEH